MPVVAMPQYTVPTVFGTKQREVRTKNEFFQSARNIINDLEETIRPCYGPDGKMRVSVGMTGKVSFGNDASSLLKKIRHTHPIATITLSSLESFKNMRGDCTAGYILTLAYLFNQMNGKDINLNEISRVQKVLSKSLRQELKQHSITVPVVKSRSLLGSSILSTCCTSGVRDALLPLIHSSICDYNKNSIPDITIFTAPGKLDHSKVINGLIFNGRILHNSMAMNPGKLLLLSSEPLLGKGKDDDKEKLIYKYDVNELSDSKKYVIDACEKFCVNVKKHGYHIVVTSSAIPTELSTCALNHSLLVIDSVQSAVIHQISHHIDSSIWDSHDVLFDDITNAPTEDKNTALVSRLSRDLFVLSSSVKKTKSILLCAPSESIQLDYSNYINKVMTAIRFSEIDGSDDGVELLPGAGADFLLASEIIRNVLPLNDFSKCLSQTVEDVVHSRVVNTVQNNTYARRQVCEARQSGFGVVSTITVSHLMSEITDCSQVMPPSEVELFEPLSGLPYLVESVLSLFISLNRINGICPSVSIRQNESEYVTQTVLV